MAKVSQFLMDKAKASAAKMTKEFGDDAVGGTKWLESKMAINCN